MPGTGSPDTSRPRWAIYSVEQSGHPDRFSMAANQPRHQLAGTDAVVAREKVQDGGRQIGDLDEGTTWLDRRAGKVDMSARPRRHRQSAEGAESAHDAASWVMVPGPAAGGVTAGPDSPAEGCSPSRGMGSGRGTSAGQSRSRGQFAENQSMAFSKVLVVTSARPAAIESRVDPRLRTMVEIRERLKPAACANASPTVRS